MPTSRTANRSVRLALLAGAVGLSLAAVPAIAQDYGQYDAAYQTDDSNIQVEAPRFHSDGARLNGPAEKLSLSSSVRYDDLNLAYPVYESSGTNCYKTALQNGELRAEAAIRAARDRGYQRYYRD